MSSSGFQIMLRSENLVFPPNFNAALIMELNMARSNPRAYAQVVRQFTSRYSSNDIAETVNYLNSIPACTTSLVSNSTLARIAQEWVQTQGPTGGTGHGAFIDRVSRYGSYRAIAENIAYGLVQPRDIVVAWIVDAGVPGKGHRLNIYNCIYNQLGIATGEHTRFRNMVSIIFANQFMPSVGYVHGP